MPAVLTKFNSIMSVLPPMVKHRISFSRFMTPSGKTCAARSDGFFAYLDKELRGAGIPTSVDVFGFTTWHTTDLGIGSGMPTALAHFDFVSPMSILRIIRPVRSVLRNPAVTSK